MSRHAPSTFSRRIRPIAVLGCALWSACGRAELDDPHLASALDQTLKALESRDMTALWNAGDLKSRELLLSSLERLEQAAAAVPEVWTGPDAEAALEAIGGRMLESLGPRDDGRGPRALAHLVAPSRLTFDDGTREGLGPRDVTFEAGPPRRALIMTQGGERFAFVEETDRWASLLIREHVIDTTNFKTLVEHADKTLALREQAHAAWVATNDPTTPQGAYNLARAAQTRNPPDVAMLFALLDADARAALKEALELGRKAQRDIQQRVNRPDRRAAYETAGLTRLVEASSDRDLFVQWTDSPDWKPLLAATDLAERLEGDPAAAHTTLLTTGGSRIAMSRDPDGFWRLGGLRTRILEALGPAPK